MVFLRGGGGWGCFWPFTLKSIAQTALTIKWTPTNPPLWKTKKYFTKYTCSTHWRRVEVAVDLGKGSLFKQNNCNSASNLIQLLKVQPCCRCWFTVYKMKGRKRLAHDIKYISAKFINHVHDLTYTECQTQNGMFPNIKCKCLFYLLFFSIFYIK